MDYPNIAEVENTDTFLDVNEDSNYLDNLLTDILSEDNDIEASEVSEDPVDSLINLPGGTEPKAEVTNPKKEKRTNAKTNLPVEKPFVGFKSNYKSNGVSFLSDFIKGLEIIKNKMAETNEGSNYKITNYKSQIRFTFESIKPEVFIASLAEDEMTNLGELGWFWTNKFIGINIA